MLQCQLKSRHQRWTSGCAQWWKEPLLNKMMPLQWSQCSQHEVGAAVIVQSALYSLPFTDAVLLIVPLKKLQGHFFLVLSKMQFPLPSWRAHLIILQGTNKFNWPNKLILDLHSWLQIPFKYTLRTRHINANNIRVTFFQGAQRSSLQLCSFAYIYIYIYI